jgi:hypothetical protein
LVTAKNPETEFQEIMMGRWKDDDQLCPLEVSS